MKVGAGRGQKRHRVELSSSRLDALARKFVSETKLVFLELQSKYKHLGIFCRFLPVVVVDRIICE